MQCRHSIRNLHHWERGNSICYFCSISSSRNKYRVRVESTIRYLERENTTVESKRHNIVKIFRVAPV